MITGIVTADREATIPLLVVGPGTQQQITGIIDSGYTGQLTLPPAIIAAVGLTLLGREEGILADGTVDIFDVYTGAVSWHGQLRAIEIDAVNFQPLVGMGLLDGNAVRMDVVTGGLVSITPLP